MMKNRLAVGIGSISLREIDPLLRRMMLFEAEGELIVAVDEEILSLGDVNYLCLWLLGKRVEQIYGDGIPTESKRFLETAGIKVYPLEAIRSHPLLQALLLKEEGHDAGKDAGAGSG